MTFDVFAWASSIVMPSGRYYGRRLGEVVAEEPAYVEWVSRKWRDPGIRAAARVLLDRVEADDVGGLDTDLIAAAVATARSSEAA